MLSFAFSLGLAALVPGPAAGQHFPPDADLQLMLRYLVVDGGVPGIVLGVLEADGSTRIVSYGSGGPDAPPPGPEAVFEIGSLTKTFTATLLADMVLRGEVALEDPVSKYLPAGSAVPSRGGRQVTLLDLATHTSGLPRLPDNHVPPDPQDPYAGYTVEMLYAFLAGHALRRDPGATREYSNLGYGLLGHALARAAGKPFAALLRERVLAPLGMEMTGYALAGPVAEWMTRGHAEGATVPFWFGTEASQGAGGLRSNAEDMLKYLKANAAPPVTALGRAMRMAREIRVPEGADGAGHGFSWTTVVVPGEAPVVTHAGGTGGFSARIALDPERGIGTVLLANTAGLTDGLAAELLFPDPPPADWRSPEDPGGLAQYAGEYRGSSGAGAYRVRLEDEGFLTYQPESRPRARLYAKRDGSFFLLRGPWTFTFRRSEAGAVTGVTMEIDSREPGQAGLRRELERISGAHPVARPGGDGSRPAGSGSAGIAPFHPGEPNLPRSP